MGCSGNYWMDTQARQRESRATARSTPGEERSDTNVNTCEEPWRLIRNCRCLTRETEKADFDALQADYDESIDAIGRAIAVLKKEQGKTPQSLLQLQKVSELKMVPLSTKRTLLA